MRSTELVLMFTQTVLAAVTAAVDRAPFPVCAQMSAREDKSAKSGLEAC